MTNNINNLLLIATKTVEIVDNTPCSNHLPLLGKIILLLIIIIISSGFTLIAIELFDPYTWYEYIIYSLISISFIGLIATSIISFIMLFLTTLYLMIYHIWIN